MSAPSKPVVDLVLSRDRAACAACGGLLRGERGREWSVHHRRPRGSGGSSVRWVNLPANLVTVHGSGTQLCHGRIEAERVKWRERGFLVSLNGVLRADEVPIMHAIHGLVLLDDSGGFERVSGEGWAY